MRTTRSNDYYLTITESKKRFDEDGYDRHKVFLYKEDFNKFLEALQETVNHVKTELMPEYDFDEFSHRNDDNDDNNSGYSSSSGSSYATQQKKEESEEERDEKKDGYASGSGSDTVETEVKSEETKSSDEDDEDALKW